ncbi:MAG: family 78 glycoside hydrolase catalytic domain [Planctomycetota bacterium]
MTQPFGRFPTSCDWRAQWIWHEHAPQRNAWVLFRHTFDVERTAGARLAITADTRYRLWINGQRLGDGPPQSQPYHQYYDEYPLDEVLTPGASCVAVLVHHQGLQPHTRGGLLCEITDADGETLAATGDGWRCQLGRAWRQDTYLARCNKIGPFQEHVDLRRMPAGWQADGFDDRGWDRPAVLATRGCSKPPAVMPWCRLIPRDIARLEQRDIYPAAPACVEECLDLANRHRSEDLSISLSQAGRPVDWAVVENADALLGVEGDTVLGCSTRHQDHITDGRYDPCLTLDFGRVLTGYAEIDVDAPVGAVIEIGYAERLVDGRFVNAIECPFADMIVCAEGRNTFRPLVWRSLRYLRVRVKNAETPVRVSAIRVVEVRYPFANRGGFAGDTGLEAVFALCRRTLELCSIESLMDTPFREQAQWLGDVAAVTVPGLYACFGETALPGKFLRQAAINTLPTGLPANHSNIVPTGLDSIPDYALWWVIGLWRHYQYTGDGRYLHECYPELQRVMRVHLERLNAAGLIEDMFGWMFIDWADTDRRGMVAAYNAIFAGACDAAAAVARFKGDAWAAEQYTDAAGGVRRAFQPTFLHPQGGLVVDCVADETSSAKVSEHANAAAVAFGCLDESTAGEVLRRIFIDRSARATEAQPFFMGVVLEALRRIGRRDVAVDLVAERWGRMLARGQTSCSEEWYINGSWRHGTWLGFYRTLSHAWSACAAEFLITGLGGIAILDPGCTRLRVDPHPARFPYAVTYPTPRGDVRITWDGADADVEAPPGVDIVR